VSANSIYPSNWELSAARSSSVARYMIEKYNIKESLFTVVGYGDTKPLDTNTTPQGRDKNRRVEIVILKNQMAKYEPMGTSSIAPENNPTAPSYKPKKNLKQGGLGDAAQQLLENSDTEPNDVIILDEYNKPQSNIVKEAINNFETGKQIEKEKLNSNFR